MPLTYNQFGGYLPFWIGNSDRALIPEIYAGTAYSVEGLIDQLSLSEFCKIYWLGKSVDYDVNIDYSYESVTVNHFGTDTTTLIGSVNGADTIILSPDRGLFGFSDNTKSALPQTRMISQSDFKGFPNNETYCESYPIFSNVNAGNATFVDKGTFKNVSYDGSIDTYDYNVNYPIPGGAQFLWEWSWPGQIEIASVDPSKTPYIPNSFCYTLLDDDNNCFSFLGGGFQFSQGYFALFFPYSFQMNSTTYEYKHVTDMTWTVDGKDYIIPLYWQKNISDPSTTYSLTINGNINFDFNSFWEPEEY